MKRIGIISHYHNNDNYGGNLQAYALSISIINLGCAAEQVDYTYWDEISKSIKKNVNKECRIKYLINIGIHLPSKLNKKYYFLKYHEKAEQLLKDKQKKNWHFNYDVIPHSQEVYTSKNISEILNQYDAFITGSDQVWNPDWYTPVFFLDFVPSDKIKISYAASISKDSLTEEERAIFKKSLADFKAVSVREEQAADLIKDLSPVPPCVTLDPTLLLDERDWDEVCAPRVEADDYIFCYFLGDNKKERKIAKQFAKKNGLKIVSVPLTGTKVYSDLKFGDVILPAASPEEFISLIKYAQYVFTDSFHAVVFSQIYHRQYFVFNRDAKGSMNSRIINITNLFNTQERFCNGRERETFGYVQSLKDIDYSRKNEKFEELKEFSIDFLKENLKAN